jgi:glycerophosphoryl diester phosphodiesterase
MSEVHERRLYGHRGASASVAENTMESFQRAIVDGANAIELDVHVSADGHAVVSHDADGRRRAGVRRAIRDCSMSELRGWNVGASHEGVLARMPTFDEVLEAFPGVRLNVDIKPPDVSAVPRVLEAIERHRAAGRVTLASFHQAVLSALVRQRFAGEIGLGPSEVVQLWLGLTRLSRRFRPRGVAVQIPPRFRGLRLDTPAFIARCHALGLRVDYWVVNDPNAARVLLEAGADGIMSDEPATIAPVMSATSSFRPCSPDAPTDRTARR